MATHDRHLTWVDGRHKDSGLFIALLAKLLRRYPHHRIIHVILDNYGIHTSRRTQTWLSERGHRIRLHFLPPYCPDDNPIERAAWRELHQNVTYNHQCRTIEQLLAEAEAFLRRLNHQHHRQGLSGLRKAI